jgi:cellulose biosynthesis protein BcsQ
MTLQTNTHLEAPKNIPRSLDGLAVSEAIYWEKYYEASETIYEWNNGILEEKRVSDHLNVLMYIWFLKILDHFLEVYPIAKIAALEMGFRFTSAQKNVIRRPDLGIVLNHNLVSLEPDDCTYKGIFDLCVEALSTSTSDIIKRDTVAKKAEYANAGVKEYYILDAGPDMGFYHLNAHGIYIPIRPTKDGIIKSKVLPGFQFRQDDFYKQLTNNQMIENPVYQGFVLPDYQEAKRKAKEEKQRADQEKQRAEQNALEAKQAKQQVKEAEAEIVRLKSLLATQDNTKR